MSKIVPLISSGTAGPNGVLHLPRLWQKVSLEAAGKIADGYPGIGAGYDSMVIDALGLSGLLGWDTKVYAAMSLITCKLGEKVSIHAVVASMQEIKQVCRQAW